MNDGFHALDIIFFAMAAVFLVMRLRSVLGKRTGHERKPGDGWMSGPPRPAETGDAEPTDNVIDLSRKRKPAAPAADIPTQGPVGGGIAAIRAADRSFNAQEFLGGARMAFEMIVAAFAAGDKKALRPLLADQVYKPFCDAVDARARAGHELTTELMGIRSADIVEAAMVGSIAQVTVRFVSEQINVVKDLDGVLVEGDPSRMIDVIDEWTFSRDTRSDDPNWQLSATRAPQDDEVEAAADED